MTSYSVKPRDYRLVKRHKFLLFAKYVVKSIECKSKIKL